MPKIHILPRHIANQIAAGEVVERPASVVKELIENSLDASAAHIKIHLEEGGKRLIRVTDDGIGMSKQDLLLCVERHATSKILTQEDLYSIKTLGFRGEALPSIAAVSRLTISSRQKGHDGGWKVEVCFGKQKDITAVGCPEGTSVLVEDLFLEIPARRAFLKRDSTEQGHVAQVVRLMMAAHPDALFELSSASRNILRSIPGLEYPKALWPLVGEDLTERLLSIEGSLPGMRVYGWISAPEDGLSTGRAFFVFLNKRPIQSRLIWKAVTQALKGHYMRGLSPIGVIFLALDPPLVDVNVHPSKQQVRFHHEQQVFRLVYGAVKRAMESRTMAGVPVERSPVEEPEIHTDRQARSGHSPVLTPLPWETQVYSRQRKSNWEMKYAISEKIGAYEPAAEVKKATESGFRVLCQFDKSFILVESPEGLMLIDQHAAHEAINFKKLMESIRRGIRIVSQALVVPMVIEVTEDQIDRLSELDELLKDLGIVAEPFGQQQILVRSVPACLIERDAAAKQILEQLLTSSYSDKETLLHDIVSSIACHSSIKANQVLSLEQMEGLIAELLEHGVTNCPHGRPVSVVFSNREIRRRFGR